MLVALRRTYAISFPSVDWISVERSGSGSSHLKKIDLHIDLQDTRNFKRVGLDKQLALAS